MGFIVKTVSKAAYIMREMIPDVLEFSEIEKITTRTCTAYVLPLLRKFQCSRNADQDMVKTFRSSFCQVYSTSLR